MNALLLQVDTSEQYSPGEHAQPRPLQPSLSQTSLSAQAGSPRPQHAPEGAYISSSTHYGSPVRPSQRLESAMMLDSICLRAEAGSPGTRSVPSMGVPRSPARTHTIDVGALMARGSPCQV